MIKAAEAESASPSTDKTIVIPATANPRQQQGGAPGLSRHARRNPRQRRQARSSKGRTLDDTIAARPTAAFDAKWGQFLITPDLFTRNWSTKARKGPPHNEEAPLFRE